MCAGPSARPGAAPLAAAVAPAEAAATLRPEWLAAHLHWFPLTSHFSDEEVYLSEAESGEAEDVKTDDVRGRGGRTRAAAMAAVHRFGGCPLLKPQHSGCSI